MKNPSPHSPHLSKPWPWFKSPTHSSPPPEIILTMSEKAIIILRSLLQPMVFEQSLEGRVEIERWLRGRWEMLFRGKGLNEQHLIIAVLQEVVTALPGETEWVGLQQDRKYVFLGSNSSDLICRHILVPLLGVDWWVSFLIRLVLAAVLVLLAHVPYAPRQGWVWDARPD